MKRYKKQDILQSISILKKANDAVVKTIHKVKCPDLEETFAQCQESAILLGTYLETQGEEGISLVTILEDYCENIYQMSQSLQDESACRKISKKIQKQLVQVENGIKFQLPPDRREVVFLPYKASMWDSLESVWMAADQDENCDVYVIPIPYYDKNPDGSFREMHYEGEQYPEYVPVTWYEDYDFAARRPDIIFIHNPYDDCNYVTSVHPFFYAKNLKQFTDKLVYIPYYILGEEMYTSFCVSPGTVVSDIVIAQSLRAKKDYMFHLKKWYLDNTNMSENVVEHMLSEKFLPLGSPKIDKVVNHGRDSYVLPEEWKELLRGKKAVLYNTGVSGILNGNEQELKKIKDTITFFKKREDVVLWWRPHPLTTGTLQSMRPQLHEEYLAIIREYKASGIGIFDDTTDLHRALLWTDMYYGDDSSLIFLYGVQGKTILLQDIDYLTELHMEEKDCSISYSVSCYASDCIIFAARNYNRLYSLDLLTKSINEIGEVPQEYQMEISLYSNIIHRGESLWLVPSRAHSLAEYCLATDEWTQYELPDRIKYSTEVNGIIYMISSDYDYLWTMNLKERKLEREKLIYPQTTNRPQSEYYNDDLYLIENKLYYLITHSNVLAMYDLVSKKVELIPIGSGENKYLRLLYDNNYFWCIPDDEESSLVRWDGVDLRETAVNAYPTGFSFRWGFSEAVCINDGVLLFPQRGNMILHLDKRSMEIESILEFDRCMDIQNVQLLPDNRLAFASSVSQMDCHITIMDYNGSVLDNYAIVCPNNMKVASDRMFDRLDIEKYNSRWAYQIKEVREYNISAACDALVKANHINREEKNYFRGLYANGDGSSGKSIWEKVRDL